MINMLPAILVLEPRGILGWVVIGLIAGALAGRVVEGRGLGCLGDIVVGVAGAFVGVFIAGLVNLNGALGFFGELVLAFIGAVILLAAIRVVTGRR